jgi:hypothetical protein
VQLLLTAMVKLQDSKSSRRSRAGLVVIALRPSDDDQDAHNAPKVTPQQA